MAPKVLWITASAAVAVVALAVYAPSESDEAHDANVDEVKVGADFVRDPECEFQPYRSVCGDIHQLSYNYVGLAVGGMPDEEVGPWVVDVLADGRVRLSQRWNRAADLRTPIRLWIEDLVVDGWRLVRTGDESMELTATERDVSYVVRVTIADAPPAADGPRIDIRVVIETEHPVQAT